MEGGLRVVFAPKPQKTPVNGKKAGDLHAVLKEPVPGHETPERVKFCKKPCKGIEKKHDMSVRCSGVRA